MTLNKIFEQEKLFELEQYNFEKNIITDDVVGVAFCALKNIEKLQKTLQFLHKIYLSQNK